MRLVSLAVLVAVTLGLAACDETRYRGANRHNIPIPPQMMALMAEKGVDRDDPILIRSFKKESELELWKKASDGRYRLLKTYPMCRWSGQLGPKKREGDRQAPEGFYDITPAQMNPNSAFYLSFNMGYPNAFDRAHNRTGSHLMVHGACSSAGCYSMTDDQIAEIYALVREAHRGGQQAVQMQSFPFRMTAENMARHRYDSNIAFWRNIKEGADIFEVARVAPRVSVCGGRYAFNRTEDCKDDPALAEITLAAAQKRRDDETKVAQLVASGTPAVRLVYEDGGQHQRFREILVASGAEALDQKASWGSRAVGVSRPDAAVAAPREIVIDSTGRPKAEPATAVAAVTPRPATPPAAPTTAPAQAQPASPQPTPAARTVTARPASPAPADTAASASQGAAPAAAPETTAVARSAPDAPQERSLMQRVLSFNPFAAPAPAEEPVAVRENPAPVPTRAPLPPRRAEAQGTASQQSPRAAQLQ